jgi:S-sulfo-L-cysteine synthase (O-acetyl-L-serine-dependent)
MNTSLYDRREQALTPELSTSTVDTRHHPVEVIDLIGNTPLMRLNRIRPRNPKVEVYAKAEWANPGGSVKDRPARSMILDGERTGKLRPGKIILDATSGNTGIAYAMIGAARGYPVHLCLPVNANEERKRLLRAYGAHLILTDPRLSSDGAIIKARELVAAEPDKYFYPDQYNNPANWQAHYHTTAPEIWEQTQGRITHFVAGLGTSGTFMGTGRRLREYNPHIRLISFEPDAPFHGLEGMKYMATSIVPGIYDPKLADGNRAVGTEEAHAMVKRLAREEGVLVGISAAAALVCSLRLAEELEAGVIVTIFCDSGTRYLSERFWQMEDNGDPVI